jgi:CBS-domain-containing membrane protein
MNAMDVMVRDVLTVKPDTSVVQAARLLVENDISALPVVDDEGRMVGIISEADLMRREEIGTEKRRPWWLEAMTPATTLANEFAKSHGKCVGDLMSRQVVSASEDTPLAEIAAILERHQIKRVPITKDGKVIGVVSRANIVQALASSKAKPDDERDSDRAIRLDVLARLREQSWTDFGSRNVIVADGVVHLWGLVGSAEERKALRSLAESVPGVTGVVDEMIPAY